MTNCLMPDEAHAVWDLLVQKAGAFGHDEDRYAFVAYLTDEHSAHEYRFGTFGRPLGFGGTLHRNGSGVYVSCYREDRDEVRAAIVAAVNARLDEMFSEAAQR